MGDLVMYTTLLLLYLLWTVRLGMSGSVSSLSMYVLMGIGCLVYAGFISYVLVWSTYRKNYDWTKFNWADPIPGEIGNCAATALNDKK